MLVSVVMAVYNGAKYLEEALESILAQTFGDFELIVIDDGSEDGTSELLERYACSDGRVHVYHQKHGGLVAALNHGCQLAQAPYIARMDADDVAFSCRLQQQVDFLQRSPGVALLGSGYVLINSDGRRGSTLRKPTADSQIRAMMQLGLNAFLHPTVVMRRDAFLSMGGYRREFMHAEDYDLWLRFVDKYEVANLPQPLIYYRVHADQVSHQKLEAGVMSALASRACARRRDLPVRVSLAEGNNITREVLRDLGVSELTVKQSLSQALFWHATLMLSSGNRQNGSHLLAGALSHSQAMFLRHMIGEWLWRIHGSVIRDEPGRARRVVTEVLLLLYACCTRVEIAKRLLQFDIGQLYQYLKYQWLKYALQNFLHARENDSANSKLKKSVDSSVVRRADDPLAK